MTNYQAKVQQNPYMPEVDKVHILEGAELFDILCPTSELTGHRTNIIDVAQMLRSDPQKAQLIDAVLQELPTVQHLDVSDEELLNTLKPRLFSGTKSEDSAYIEFLENNFKDIQRIAQIQPQSVSKEGDTNKISFEDTNSPSDN